MKTKGCLILKRPVILYLVCILLISCALDIGLAGCSDNTGKAKEYMRNATGMEVHITRIFQDMTGSLLTVMLNFQNLSSLESEVQRAKVIDNDHLKTLDDTSRNLKKIKALKGVPEYKKYADLLLQESDLIRQGFQQAYVFMDNGLSMVRSGNTDINQLRAQFDQCQQQISSLQARASELSAQGQALEKKLIH
jgi:uncharacterized lipoprotein YehR (DUF1307 family)